MSEFINAVVAYPFMQRALAVGIPVSLCCALLGIILVLKKYSMIGDGLSHVGFGALAVALALDAAPLLVALPVVTLAAFLLLRLDSKSFLRGDAGIAVVSTGAMAIGITALSLKGGINTDIYSYMFGSILSVGKEDVALSIIVAVCIILLFTVFYNRIFSVTFDEGFAEATGQKSRIYNSLIAVLTAATVVIGMRIMGTLLISSLIIFPALTAMGLTRSFKGTVFLAGGVSVVCFLLGMVISFTWSLPTGASIVLCNLAALVVSRLISAKK